MSYGSTDNISRVFKTWGRSISQMKALLASVFRRAAWALSSSETAFEEEGDLGDVDDVVDCSLIFIADLEMLKLFQSD